VITFVTGDIFKSRMKTLVNTVNCVGVMGKGLALEFKNRFPEMYIDYTLLCGNQQVKPGIPYCYDDNFLTKIINFPTKNHWRDPSKIEWISNGLNIFIESYIRWGIVSVAFPALGCNNGELNWNVVKTLMESKLSTIDIPIEIYEPVI